MGTLGCSRFSSPLETRFEFFDMLIGVNSGKL